MKHLRATLVLATVLAAGVAACTFLTDLDGLTCTGAACTAADATSDGQTTGTGDASDTHDASPINDAAPGLDAAPDTNPPIDAATPLSFFCPGGASVTDCAACASAKYPCILCGSAGSDVGRLRGICVTTPDSGSACQGKGPAGFDDCLCTKVSDPGPCPEPYQVCAAASGPACRTCGFNGSAGSTCKGGGICTAAGACQ